MAELEPLYASALWLLGRHPHLAALVGRMPGLDSVNGDRPTIDLDALAAVVVEYDQNAAAWEVYGLRYPPPADDDDDWERWHANGPVCAPHVEALGCMSGSERSRLRLLATLASTRVPIRVADFRSFDAAGQLLLADWAAAVCAA